MALFDFNNSRDDTNNANDAINQYYGDAASYMSPYTSAAGTDFNTARKGLYGALGQMSAQGNPNQPFYKILGTGPENILNQAESGYKMSPATMNQMKIGQSAVNNQLTAEGLEGSGEGALESAEIGSMIYSQGMQQYLGNLTKTFDQQLKVLGIDDQQRQGIIGEFGKMIGLEQHSSNQMADIAQKSGQESANVYQNQARIDEQHQPLNQLASIAGAGLGAYEAIKHPATGLYRRM